MKRHCYLILLIKIFFILFDQKYVEASTIRNIRSTNEKVSAYGQKVGLYYTHGSVVILDGQNFKSNIYNSTLKSSWLVKFYANWCGHCKKIAPIYQTFADNLHYLRGTVKIAAVDCGNELNTYICRDFNVKGYPELKFFPACSKPDFLGTKLITGHDATELENILFNQLRTESSRCEGLPTTFIPDSKVHNHNNENSTPILNKNQKNRQNSSQQIGDDLYQIDLETTMFYSLKHEIALKQNISGEKMLVLQNYLYTLNSYFPMRENNTSFLKSLYTEIYDKTSISGENFEQIIRKTEDQVKPVLTKSQDWIGCEGENREYTCGLWTMFHMLTVNAKDEDYNKLNISKVLQVMYWYVRDFFGCEECSTHFVEMAKRNKIFDIKSKDESILWLWRAHNEVNKRLASEEESSIKIQYPGKNNCPSCRDKNDNWIESEVLHYLKKKYSHNKINFYGTTDNPNIKYLVQRSLPNNIVEQINAELERIEGIISNIKTMTESIGHI